MFRHRISSFAVACVASFLLFFEKHVSAVVPPSAKKAAAAVTLSFVGRLLRVAWPPRRRRTPVCSLCPFYVVWRAIEPILPIVVRSCVCAMSRPRLVVCHAWPSAAGAAALYLFCARAPFVLRRGRPAASLGWLKTRRCVLCSQGHRRRKRGVRERRRAWIKR